jgi:hypothetical protein
LQHSHPELEAFLRQYQIPFVSLETTRPAECYSGFGRHWTPEGQRVVAGRIEAFFQTHLPGWEQDR